MVTYPSIPSITKDGFHIWCFQFYHRIVMRALCALMGNGWLEAALGKVDADKAKMAETTQEPSSLAKLQAHFDGLDDASLLRVARAVEMARATAKPNQADDQILESLRPRLRALRPERLCTFQRAACGVLAPFIHDDAGTERRKASVPRGLLAGWWRVLMTSPRRSPLVAAESDYSKAIRAQDHAAAETCIAKGIAVAAEETLEILAEADRSIGRRSELVTILGGERALQDMREIAALLRHAPVLGPLFSRIREEAGAGSGQRILDFTPASVIAARNGYLHIHAGDQEAVEYFFFGLIGMLAQPWQALRLVRVLSQDMAQGGANSQAVRMIPARLFSDLTRTLAEIGKSGGGAGPSMGRRVWLMTCARLVSDAAAMLKGLAEELQADPTSDWHKPLMDARTKAMQAVDVFASAAVTDCQATLPVKQTHEKMRSEARVEPDMARMPMEEDAAVAQAAASLFTAVRKLAEQEGEGRSFRSKEADLEQKLEIGINFRIEFLRARPKNPVALAQLAGVLKVLKALPSMNIIRDLDYRVERMIERYKH
jgi:hypothetical protein